ncbi:MAG: endonuclease [Microgenomates bacterium 39_7]|nr:MAG: endonuclease [Microgenomates bacterium 39_7]
MKKQSWVVYIVQCADGTLYTGCTNNLESRLLTHNQDKGAKYTRGRTPVKLKYSKKCTSRSEAQQLEYEIKQLPRKEKEELLVASNSPTP